LTLGRHCDAWSMHVQPEKTSTEMWYQEFSWLTAAAARARAPIGRIGSSYGSWIQMPYEVKYAEKARMTGSDWKGPRRF
jgi:hypothetical protein